MKSPSPYIYFATLVATFSLFLWIPLTASAEQAGPEHDRPDLAAQDFLEQRFGNGERGDLVELYGEALDRIAEMPRHSLRQNRSLPASERSPFTAKSEFGTWESLGPGNVGGRTRALVVDPDRPRIRYAAGVSGGIWKTEDAGRSWRPLTDLLPNIAVNSLVMDPGDSKILYAGTGEGVFREVVRQTSLPLRGAGIFKTVDGGETWQWLESTRNANFSWVNDLAISHRDPRRVYAATRSGVWRSRNGGQTWTRQLNPRVTGGCFDLALRTDRPADQLFAACGTFEQSTVYRNANAAANRPWEAVLSEEGMGRTRLALAPSNQNIIYALSASYPETGPLQRFKGGLHAVYRSDGAGNVGTWNAVTRNTDPEKIDTTLLSYTTQAHGTECGFDQDGWINLGWYAAVLAVDPTDPEIVFLGGVNLFRSDDGGRSWGVIGYQSQVHVDQHVMVFHPAYDGVENQILFVGNDGGLWRTGTARGTSGRSISSICNQTNGVEWAPLNNGYGVTQFYHGVVFPNGVDTLGGTQDNGTQFNLEQRGSDGWVRILGGDGGYSAIDPRNPEVIYAEAQGLNLFRTGDGGNTWERRVSGIQDFPGGGDDTGDLLFIVPFAMDPSDPDRLWYGGRHLWRTDNGALQWRQAAAAWPRGAKLSAVAVAPTDSDRVAVGLNDGGIHVSAAALTSTAATQWPGKRPREGFVSWITFDPSNPERVYATYATFGGKHLWASDDAGNTWRPLDGTGPTRLPNLPAHTVLVDPRDGNRLYVGTDLGVFVSTDRGKSWAVENTGFANVVTEALQWAETPDGKQWLYAFTHGRGAFRVEMPPLGE